jgi:translation initiation factor 1A
MRKRGTQTKNRELVFKADGMEYALVSEMLGNHRVQAQCTDNVSRVCTIRGSMQKRVWIHKGDWVLVGLREFETRDTKADIILKYTPDEVRYLQRVGEIPDADAEETDVVFDEDVDVDDI